MKMKAVFEKTSIDARRGFFEKNARRVGVDDQTRQDGATVSDESFDLLESVQRLVVVGGVDGTFQIDVDEHGRRGAGFFGEAPLTLTSDVVGEKSFVFRSRQVPAGTLRTIEHHMSVEIVSS
jgi:hypothetical protein